MSRLGDHLELVRAPAALTVLGDALVGALSAGRAPHPGRIAALALSSTCLYAAGMAANDYADAELDARERPERPIPSGRITRTRALGTALGLTGAGVGAAFVAGRSAGLVSLALAAALWSYDLVFKSTAAGPFAMAACRGLDVLMGGAGRGWRGAAVPAAAVAVHTLGVTAVSRGEVAGTTPGVARGAVAASVAAAAAGLLPPGQAAAAVAGGAHYLAGVLPAQTALVDAPTASAARAATRDGIRGVVRLQAAFAARAGAPLAAAALLGIDVLGRSLGRRAKKGDIT
ncbi:SCO3242 family prenyltransferase [Microbacterium sp. NPDC091313]